MAWLIIPLTFTVESPYFLFKSWNLFTMLCSMPSIILALLLMRMPESPKFLLAKGRYNETMDCLKFVYRWNNKYDDKFPVRKIPRFFFFFFFIVLSNTDKTSTVWLWTGIIYFSFRSRFLCPGDFRNVTGRRRRTTRQGIFQRALRQHRRTVHVQVQIHRHYHVYHTVLRHYQVNNSVRSSSYGNQGSK